MKETTVKELSIESFSKYGSYANMIDPDCYKLGAEPIEFYRDMIKLDLGNRSIASFSVCRVSKRPMLVDISEFHNGCGEGSMPIDGDVLIHVGPATGGDKVPVDEIEIFRVPKGTFVSINPGVWHHAAFAYGQDVVNVLIVLPERTYAIDCEVREISDQDQVKIA